MAREGDRSRLHAYGNQAPGPSASAHAPVGLHRDRIVGCVSMTDLERVIDVCVRTDLGLRDEAVLLAAMAELSAVLYDGKDPAGFDLPRKGDGSVDITTRRRIEAVVEDLRIALKSIKGLVAVLGGGA